MPFFGEVNFYEELRKKIFLKKEKEKKENLDYYSKHNF